MESHWVAQSDLRLDRLDADFHRRVYVDGDRALRGATGRSQRLKDLSARIFKGAFYVLQEEYAPRGVPFLRTLEIKPGFVDLGDCAFIPPAVHLRERKTAVSTGNLVVAKTGGSIGYSAIIPSGVKDANICQDLVGVRLRDGVDPYYVDAVIKSPLGQLQALRWRQGNAHPHLGLEGIRSWTIPRSPSLERAIGNKLRKAERLRELASKAWSAALDRLAAEVGQPFDAAAFEAPARSALDRAGYHCLSLRPPMARAIVTDEIGAQYFHPRREYARQVAARTGSWESLERLARPIQKQGKGRGFVGLDRIDSNTGVVAPAASDDPAEGVLFENDDILFSRLRPYLNKVAIWAGSTGVGSPELLIFRPRGGIDPHYLFAAVKSPLGLYQVIDVTSGSTHPRVDAEVVAGIRVPRLAEDVETMIGESVRAAMAAWRHAPPLVDAAKAAVEALIHGTLEEAVLLAESGTIEQWLTENPSPSRGA